MSRPMRSCRIEEITATTLVEIGPSKPSEDPEEVGEDAEANPRASKKRARRAADDVDGKPIEALRKKSYRPAKLARLQEMPLEVLLQIFSFLHPHELLHVSRMTKTLRALLMTRCSRVIWVQALSAVPDLPPCPEDLTECAGARLLFDPVCHICDAKGVRNVLWALRVRTCAKCIEPPLPLDSVLHREEGVSPYHYTMGLIDHTTFDYRIPFVEISEPRARRRRFVFLHKEFIELYDAVQKRRDGDTGQQVWIDACTKRGLAVREHAKLCEKWASGERGQRAEEIKASRQNRKEAILRNLRELGYGQEVDFMQRYAAEPRGPLHEFEHLKSVNQAKELSPRIWTNIQSEVLEFMNSTIRPKCRVDGQIRTLCDRVKCLVAALEARTTSYAPRVIDLYSLDSIRSVLDQPLENAEDIVTSDSFADALSDYDAIIGHCEAQRRLELLHALGSGPRDEDDARLHLATSLWTCQTSWRHSCRTSLHPMDYNEALTHRCTYDDWSKHAPMFGDDEWAMSDRLQQVKLVCAVVPGAGNINALDTSKSAEEHASWIVQLAGLDPASATATDMDAADAWFDCISPGCYKCREEKKGLTKRKSVFDWRKAVVHRMELPSAPLQRLAPAEEERARKAASATPVFGLSMIGLADVWDCRHCTKTRMTQRVLQDHCEQIHAFSMLRYGKDFVSSGGLNSSWHSVSIDC